MKKNIGGVLFKDWKKKAMKSPELALAWLYLQVQECDPCDGGCNVTYLQKKSAEAMIAIRHQSPSARRRKKNQAGG